MCNIPNDSNDIEKTEINIEKNISKNKHKPIEPVPFVRILFLVIILDNPGITGYEIMQLVPKKTNKKITLKTGTVYTELRKLEQMKFVQSSQTLKGRKQRKYKITPLGIKELERLSMMVRERIHNVLLPLLELVDLTLVKNKKRNQPE